MSIGRWLPVDHIIPVAHDGTAHPYNGMVLCGTCHRAKSKVQVSRRVYQRPERKPDASYYVTYAARDYGPFDTLDAAWRTVTVRAKELIGT